MDSVANLHYLPKTKFRELKGGKSNDNIKDYELKKGNIRLYMFMLGGYIIVFNGTKNKQKEDIPRLRRIKNEYKDSVDDNKRRTFKKQ